MSESYDVVIAGAGHNALITGSYLAKAGLSVCIVERKEKAGGSVATTEDFTGKGFHQDVCSVSHSMLMGNPLIRNDELELISKFGLEYANPEKMTVLYFDDDTHLEFWSDLDRTCASMAKISPKDADNFRRFCTQVDQTMGMLVMGMYSVPPSPGMQAMMMDATPEGQEMMRLQAISAWDLICEWIENPKIRIALARYASEAMLNPFDNGTGFGFYVILPYMYRFGTGICIGGSGALAEALGRCFIAHGGVIRLNSEVKEILIESGEAKGLILTDGETIRADKAVVAGLHIAQIFPHMVPGFELPPGFQHRVDTLKYADFQPMTVHLSLNEPLDFKYGNGIEDYFWVERCHSDVEEFRRGFQNLQYGIPDRNFACWVQQFRADPSRVPEGKGTVHIYAFMPLDLKEGGREKWDEIGAEIAQGFIDDLREQVTNLTDDNIIATHFMTPLDITRYNTSLVNGDIQHIGFFSWQLGGNRPVPGWGQYRMPVPKLYMTAGSTHPGGGVTGGPGRNAVQVIMEDLGLDFEKVSSN
jgi:phytoene dehydrogenase-like protein